MKTHNILSIEVFKKKIGNNSRLMGIDPGKINIGVAICDENRIVATPYETIKKNKFSKLSDSINKIIKENNVNGIIIGNPLKMDGSSGRSSQSAMDFAINLSKKININITMWDERLSSKGVFNITKGLNTSVSKKIKNLDKNSAAFILQGAIDYISN